MEECRIQTFLHFSYQSNIDYPKHKCLNNTIKPFSKTILSLLRFYNKSKEQKELQETTSTLLPQKATDKAGNEAAQTATITVQAPQLVAETTVEERQRLRSLTKVLLQARVYAVWAALPTASIKKYENKRTRRKEVCYNKISCKDKRGNVIRTFNDKTY